MFALTILSLVVPLPLFFMMHDGEELLAHSRWMQKNAGRLIEKFPALTKEIIHFRDLPTSAFAIAILEEFVILLIVTLLVLSGLDVLWLWSALFLAFSVHMFIHIIEGWAIKGYVPGLISSLLLVPYVCWGIYSIWLAMSAPAFFACALGGTLGMILNLRFAHWLGRLISRGDLAGQKE
ncbi:MAG: HXXEE domain-containing protein [Parabacteroides sp.]